MASPFQDEYGLRTILALPFGIPLNPQSLECHNPRLFTAIFSAHPSTSKSRPSPPPFITSRRKTPPPSVFPPWKLWGSSRLSVCWLPCSLLSVHKPFPLEEPVEVRMNPYSRQKLTHPPRLSPKQKSPHSTGNERCSCSFFPRRVLPFLLV